MSGNALSFGFLKGNGNLVMVFNAPLPPADPGVYRLKASPAFLELFANDRPIAKQPMPSLSLFEDLKTISILGGMETGKDGFIPDCITTTVYISTFIEARA